jgi:solute carrier family 12 (potassium/chloride transporters), member 8
MVFIIFLGATVDRHTLLNDFMIASTISAFQLLFYAGIYVSSMSSCLGAMYGTPRVLQSIANESVIPGMSKFGAGRGANKIPLNAMILVAAVVITFLVGDINTLAPIVTMPFLFTYACIDYSYFALAQTFDIQTKREERFRIQAQSPLYETRNYGATHQSEYHENDLDQLFPERTRHKNLSSPENTPYHQQRPVNDVDITLQQQQDEVIIRDPVNSNHIEGQGDNDDEPIAPIRAPIHQKTKNWYSAFCNRWASLMGVSWQK